MCFRLKIKIKFKVSKFVHILYSLRPQKIVLFWHFGMSTINSLISKNEKFFLILFPFFLLSHTLPTMFLLPFTLFNFSSPLTYFTNFSLILVLSTNETIILDKVSTYDLKFLLCRLFRLLIRIFILYLFLKSVLSQIWTIFCRPRYSDYFLLKLKLITILRYVCLITTRHYLVLRLNNLIIWF